MRNRIAATAFSVFVALLSPAAMADCTNPAVPAGVIIYNDNNNVLQYCDGSNWIGMGPAGAGNALVYKVNNIADTAPAGAGATAIAMAGNHVYIAAEDAGSVTSVDISDPQNLVVRGSLTTSNLSKASGIALSGNYAFVTSGVHDRMTAVNISNPAALSEAGSISGSLKGAIGIAISGNHAFVASWQGDTLTAVNISNPAAMSVTGSLAHTNIKGARGVAITGNYALVVSRHTSNLSVINISNPASMSHVTSVSHSSLNGARAVTIDGNFAYVVSENSAALTIFDISNLAAPVFVSSLAHGDLGGAYDVTIVDDAAFIASRMGGFLTAIDISNPAAPTLRNKSGASAIADARGVVAGEYYAFVASYGANVVASVNILGLGCMEPYGDPGTIFYHTTLNTLMFCNGDEWGTMAPPGTGGAGCSGPNGAPGTMLYNSLFNLMQFCDGAKWTAIGKLPCDFPEPFSFPNETGVDAAITVSSAARQINNICFAEISIAGDGSPEFRTCDNEACTIGASSWGSGNQLIDDGQWLQLRLTSPALLGAQHTAAVNVGQRSANWSVSTRPCDSTPAAFSFTDQSDVALSATIESDIVQIIGIDTIAEGCGAAVTVSGDTGAQFRICGNASCSSQVVGWGSAGQTVDADQYVQVRVTSSGANAVTTSVTLTVGGVQDTFAVTTVPIEKIVFVATNSGNGFTGNLGGVSGGDSTCAAEATAASLSGTYKAWLADSSGTNNPANNFTGVGGGFRYKLRGGTVIANGWADLTDGTLAAAINENAAGSPASGTVWSNVTIAGGTVSTNSNTGSCVDWGSGASNRSGQNGTAGAVNSSWTTTGSNNGCNNTFLLYCFEQ